MILQLGSRIAGTVDPRLLATMAWNFGFKGARSVLLFKQRLKKGIVFPPFLYLSIINSCNLRCQGCWVDVESPRNMIELDELNRLVNDAREHGNSFFGVLGGEPFLHPGLFDFLAQHPDCYFQIFTNGQMITEKVAKKLRQLGNCTPLVSIEGTGEISDLRRGSKDVLNRTLRGLRNCLDQKLLTGVATSLCQTNMAAPPDRLGRSLHLVSYLPAGRTQDQFRPGPAPGSIGQSPEIRGRTAGQNPHRHRGRLLR
jgi:sulfatase maturation enzyme AslB (radical SAM superfamily)